MNRVLVVLLILSASISVFARTPLTFEDRVKAQEAIERVYYTHRIWPKENPQPKPLFEKMVTKEQIEAKVNDYLKKCAALDQFWQRPIVASQLQAEMERMAKGTKDPRTLNELFAALNNDPYLIAECLARPVLADRLIHNWYTNDERFHKEAREKAEEAAKVLTPENFASLNLGEYSTVTYKLENEIENSSEENLEEQSHVIRLSRDEWEKTIAKYPAQGEISFVNQSEPGFAITHTKLICDDEIQVEAKNFSKKSFSEWWEEEGCNLEIISGTEADFYNFAIPRQEEACIEGWSPTSTGGNCPSGLLGQTAVWTGSEMIIWGGADGAGNFFNTGSRYDLSTDSWTATSTGTSCPIGRTGFTSVWTGTEMIVWGGQVSQVSPVFTNTGGRYNPGTDKWVETSVGTNCPTARNCQVAVWTGTEMIIWGGSGAGNTGGRYDPTSNSWKTTSTGDNCPTGYIVSVGLWTGTEMIVWSSSTNAGRYSPSTDSWLTINTGSSPSSRDYPESVWTGSKMIVWGGIYSYIRLNTGGRYDPKTNLWSSTSTYTNCPSARYLNSAVWTGREMVIWGGDISNSSPYVTNTGGRYNPSTNTWLPTSTGTNCPSARSSHSAVWTGENMIIWGGVGLNTGGVYYIPYSPLFSDDNIATDVDGCADSGVLVEWSAPSSWGDGGSGTRTFDVLRDGIAIASGLSSSSLSYVDTTGTSDVAYLYQIRANNGCGSSTTTAGVLAGDYSYPSPSIIGDTVGCSESGVTLSTGTFSTYQWNYEGTPISGATGQTYQVYESGSYSVTVSNDGGCPGTGTSGVLAVTIYATPPLISGASSACNGSNITLSTDIYPSFQWYKDGLLIDGATNQTVDISQPGTYTVLVDVPAGSCSGTSEGHSVQFADPPANPPVISGASSNSCPATSVALQTMEPFGSYQWYYNGATIPGAKGQTYTATLSGNYSVSAGAVPGCRLASAAHSVSISFCATSEVSPKLAVYPSRIAKDTGSSTGYYLYFQKIDGADGYKIYEGDMVAPWDGSYHHAGQPGNLCSATVNDLTTGEMRAEVNPSAGDHYYLVTAYSGVVEGPSGYDSNDTQIPAVQCSP